MTSDAPPPWYTSRTPPRWLTRALFGAVVAVFLGVFVWYALGALTGLITNLIIAFFLALMLEPMVVWLVKRRWRRGAAAGAVLVGAIVFVVVLIALFGNLFVRQIIELVQSVPDMYADVRAWADTQFDVQLPASDDLIRQALGEWGDDVASGAFAVGTTIVGVIFSGLTIMLVVYYLLAAGPRFRSAICAWLTPAHQTDVLRLWEITQIKVSDFINSRVVLAMFCSVSTTIFLIILHTPYALALGLFTGVVSQFVPTIGTYIGGALPVAIALTTQGPTQALLVLGFILVYQQVENYLISPKITARALEMNPAVSFVSVLAFGAVFGALGAFLALPVVAVIQATANTWLERHALVESPMLHDPGPDAPGSSDDGTAGTPPAADPGTGPRARQRFFSRRSRSEQRRLANIQAAHEAALEVERRRQAGIE